MNNVHPSTTNDFESIIVDSVSGGEFRPLAYYDKHMDCIRIELRDCSFCEKRLNESLTLLEDNYPNSGQVASAGLVIKGVKHLFKALDLPLEGIVLVTMLIDRIIKENHLPESDQSVIRPVGEVASQIELSVNLDEELPLAA
jgi:hypothetical protein